MVKPAIIGVQRSPSLALQVHTALLELITGGQIQPGERVVIERLAEQLGVSQTPVREAVARLAQEGLIAEMANGRLHVVELSEEYVRDVFLVRGALEGLCIEIATPLIAPASLDLLRAQLDETSRALGRGDHRPYAQSDASLHHLVISATTNRVLAKELRSLQPHVDLIRGYSQRTDGAHLRASHEEHLSIVAALANRDSTRARHTMEQHIRNAGERIIQLIDF